MLKLIRKLAQKFFARREPTLRATWSFEAADDLRQVHNIEAEDLLIQEMAIEIQSEIDSAILDSLFGAADTFDFNNLPLGNIELMIPPAERHDWKKEGF